MGSPTRESASGWQDRDAGLCWALGGLGPGAAAGQCGLGVRWGGPFGARLLGGGRQLLVLCGSGQNPGEPPWPSPRLQPRGPSQALPPQPQLQGEQLPRATPPVAPPGLRAEVSSSPGVPRAGPPRVPPRSGSGLTWTEAPCRPPWSLATPSVHVVTWYPPSQALDTRHPRGLARRALWAEQRSAGTCAAPSGPPVAHTVPPRPGGVPLPPRPPEACVFESPRKRVSHEQVGPGLRPERRALCVAACTVVRPGPDAGGLWAWGRLCPQRAVRPGPSPSASLCSRLHQSGVGDGTDDGCGEGCRGHCRSPPVPRPSARPPRV